MSLLKRIWPVKTSVTLDESVPKQRVLLVCLGNICRSPTAEAVLRHKLVQAGLAAWVEVDSAGTYGGHAGCPPDERAQRHALRRGYRMDHLRARQVRARDFRDFDLILAMDSDNVERLCELCPDAALRAKLHKLTDFLPADSPFAGVAAVPDPYYGGPDGFERVLDLVEAACDGVVHYLHQRLSQPTKGSPSV